MSPRSQTLVGYGREISFVILTASWLLFGFYFASIQPGNGLFLSLILLTSAISMLSLNTIGYFEDHGPRPALPGLMTLFLTLLFSVVCSKWMIFVATDVPLMAYPTAIKVSFWVAAAFAITQWGLFKVQRATKQRWALATYLMPSELEALRSEIMESGASEWIDIRACTPDSGDAMPRTDETLVISRGATRHLNNHVDLIAAHLRGQRIIDLGELLKEFRGRVNLNTTDAWTFLLASQYQSFPIRAYFYLKTLLEPLLAVILMVLLSPVFLATALGIYFTSGRPIFYSQERLGYRGRKIFIYKFRTMKNSAEKSGPQWASEDDPRVTPFGRFLRKTRLDELPQLRNVYRGELSFVGPRPERPEFYRFLAERIPLFSLRLLVRPGITGWAQVKNGYVASVEDCRLKLEYDLYYIQNMSPRLDVRVIAKTIAMMVGGYHGR